MAKLTIEATIPSDKVSALEDGLPLLLQMMQGAGFTNISVSTTQQVPQTYEAPKPRMTAAQKRLSKEMAGISSAVKELTEKVNWIEHEVIGVAEDDIDLDKEK
jgi:hypothetical protein